VQPVDFLTNAPESYLSFSFAHISPSARNKPGFSLEKHYARPLLGVPGW
jgi:hypothetical protein